MSSGSCNHFKFTDTFDGIGISSANKQTYRNISSKWEISHRALRVKPSSTLAVAARATQLKAAGHDIINLGVGEPISIHQNI